MNEEFLSHLGLEETMISQIMEEYRREQDEKEFSRELQTQLSLAGAKSWKAAEALLNKEELIMENGVISGLSQQLDSLKEEHPYLFESEIPHVVASATGGSETERSLFSVIRSAAGL